MERKGCEIQQLEETKEKEICKSEVSGKVKKKKSGGTSPFSRQQASKSVMEGFMYSPDGKHFSVYEKAIRATHVRREDSTSFSVQCFGGVWWSPDSQYVAGFNNLEPKSALTIWRVADGQQVRVLHEHLGARESHVAWSRDSQRIASCIENNKVLVSRVHNPDQPTVVITIDSPEWLLWSANDKWLLVTTYIKQPRQSLLRFYRVDDDNNMIVFSLSVGGDTYENSRPLWSPTDSDLFCYNDRAVCNLMRLDELGAEDVGTFARSTGFCKKWSPDGQLIAFRAAENRLTIVTTDSGDTCYDVPLDVDYVKHKVLMCEVEWFSDSKSLLVCYEQDERNLIVQVYGIGDTKIAREFLLPNYGDCELRLFNDCALIATSRHLHLQQRIFALESWRPNINSKFPFAMKRFVFALLCVRQRFINTRSIDIRPLPQLPLELWLLFLEFSFTEETTSLDHLRG